MSTGSKCHGFRCGWGWWHSKGIWPVWGGNCNPEGKNGRTAVVFPWNGGMDQIRCDTLEAPHCKGGIDLHVVKIKLKLAASFIGYVHFRGLEMPESYSARLRLCRYVRYLVLLGVSSVHINSGGITHKMSVPLLGNWRIQHSVINSLHFAHCCFNSYTWMS